MTIAQMYKNRAYCGHNGLSYRCKDLKDWVGLLVKANGAEVEIPVTIPGNTSRKHRFTL